MTIWQRLKTVPGEVIAKEGHTETVSAQITDAEFPVKTYGAYTFPKGTYRALKVVIGDGAGANWWCVMYPNLCFANSVYEVIDENSKEELQTILTKEDYEEIMAAGKIRVRFKYLKGLANSTKTYRIAKDKRRRFTI